MKVTEIKGDIIKLSRISDYDVVLHGCNVFCTQLAGLAPQMVEAFGTDKFPMEHKSRKGDINKLGCIDFRAVRRRYNRQDESRYFGSFNAIYKKEFEEEERALYVVNAYTQYNYGKNPKDEKYKPVDYKAIALVFKKINVIFAGKHILTPRLGSGLAGGDWNKIKRIILRELTDCDVTLVEYKK